MKYLKCLFVSVLLLSGCANVQLVSSHNNQYKFCTNPNNQIAKSSDFDKAAEKQCGGQVKQISEGLEFFTNPKDAKIGGFLEVQKERRMCHVYECVK